MIFLATGVNRKEPLCDPTFFCTEPNFLRDLSDILLTGKSEIWGVLIYLFYRHQNLWSVICVLNISTAVPFNINGFCKYIEDTPTSFCKINVCNIDTINITWVCRIVSALLKFIFNQSKSLVNTLNQSIRSSDIWKWLYSKNCYRSVPILLWQNLSVLLCKVLFLKQNGVKIENEGILKCCS